MGFASHYPRVAPAYKARAPIVCRGLTDTSPLARLAHDRVEQIPHRAMPFDGVAQRQGTMDAVDVAPAVTLARYRPGGFKIDHDLSDRPLGDADLLGEVAEPQLGVMRERDQHVAVIAQEGPTGSWVHCYLPS